MDELIQVMSIPELKQFKSQFKDNPSIGAIIDGYIATKEKAEAEAKERQQFGAKVAKLANLPIPPSDVHNIYLAWKQVETPQEIPEGASEARIAELEANPVKTWAWVVEINKGFSVGKSSGGNGSGKRQGAFGYLEAGKPIQPLGMFANGMAVVTHVNANMPQFKLTKPIDPEKEGGGNSYRALQAHNIYELNDDGTIRPH